MLTQAQRDIVSACVPALGEHSLALTRCFYQRMFTANPELRHVFNMSRQATGEQQQALANAVLAYAQHIEHPERLAGAIALIAAKHVSMGIRAEHYPIVGQHLLDAIAQIMGDAATDQVIAAWAAAYDQLATILINAEQALYTASTTMPGGWSGWRPFRVERKEVESDVITSLYLTPADGGALPAFRPGQYVSLRMRDGNGMIHVRQYSLSDAPHQPYLRLSVKREENGKVSNVLHDATEPGQWLELSAPQGCFVIDQSHDRPVVMLSGGVGLTPMVAMLNHIARTQPQRRVLFLHAARHRQAHAMASWMRDMTTQLPNLTTQIHYDHVAADDIVGIHHDREGRIDLTKAGLLEAFADADFYICGPRPFMHAQTQSLRGLNVADERIYSETFGSALA